MRGGRYLIFNDFKPYGPAPNHRHMEWYNRGKTAFIHFGMNTFTNQEWGDGTENPELFNPTELDCEQWMSVLKEAGFTAAILTVKHHDGFCLWPSKYTGHSVKYSPYRDGKGDIVKEFVGACRKYGIKPGVYLSPWDRNHPQWGTEEYNTYYANQLTELMTQYGEIYECWWDGAGSKEAKYDWGGWAGIVRKYQPNCVIFGAFGAAPYVDVRWNGNELGRAGDPCWATIDEYSILVENNGELNRGKPDGERFIPAESNTSIRPGWFFHSDQNDYVKSPVALTRYWFSSAGKNTGILLNIPPDTRGLIHEIDPKHLVEWNNNLNEIFKTNLLMGSHVQLNGGFISNYPAENLINEDPDAVFAADSRNPEIIFRFDEPVTFNCYKLQEVIELGHRIGKFRIDYLGENGWNILVEKECVGFCRSDLVDTITTNAVRLVVTEAWEKPLLRHFGLYLAPREAIHEDFESRGKVTVLTDLPTAKITPVENGYEVDFGGIYAFNTVICDASECGAFEIFAFNGTQYKQIYFNVNGTKDEVCSFKTVEGSYKMKILFYGDKQKDRDIKVLYV